MTKKRSTRRALLLSILSLVICVSMLIGSTYAWFTDTVTSGNNRIVAGNLDVDLVMYKTGGYVSIADSTGDIFTEAAIAQNSSATLWEPGKTQVVFLGVQNKGSLALKYNVNLNITNIAGRPSMVQNGYSALEYAIIDGQQYTDVSGMSWAAVKALAGANVGDLTLGSMTAAQNGVLDEIVNSTQNETDYFALAVHMKEDAGNEFQNAGVQIDVSVVATQKDAESDSFNNQYDASAVVPGASAGATVSGTTAAPVTLSASTSEGKTIEAELPVGLIEELPDTVNSVSLRVDPNPSTVIDESVTTVTFDYADLVDQDGNVINLSNNTTPIAVTLELGAGFANRVVAIYHDSVLMTTATADADGNVTYTTTHFCVIDVKKVDSIADGAVAAIGTTMYSTLEGAVSAAQNGDTIALLKNIELNSTINIAKDVTINMNGFNISATNARALLVRSGDVKLDGTGTISATKSGESNFSSGSSVIRVGDGFYANDTVYPAAYLTVGKNVTVSSNYCYGVTAFGTNDGGQKVIVNGKIIVTGEQAALSGNGTSSLTNADFTVNDGALISAAQDYAVYHPQKGTMTVNGGTITGKGGIEAKGGNVNVLGGTITATATEFSHSTNNNGTSTSGYAIAAVENSNYKGDGNFNISGGVINGEVAVIKDIEASWTPKISITGGTFSSDVGEYVAENYGVSANKTNTEWKVLRTWKADADTDWYDGTKTEFVINTAEQLAGLAKLVNEETELFVGKTVKLGADIDLKNRPWTPIGDENHSTSSTDFSKAFKGVFDGQNYTVSNLNVCSSNFKSPRSDIGWLGLFGIVCGGYGANATNVAVIKNVTVDGAIIRGHRMLGAIVGQIYGDIENCGVKNVSIIAVPNKTGDEYDNGDKVGGIVGWIGDNNNNHHITGCSATDVILTAYRDVGGIAGHIQTSTTISGCIATNISITVDKVTNSYGNDSRNAGYIYGRAADSTTNTLSENTEAGTNEITIVTE